MSFKICLVFCVQALFIHYSLAQALRGLASYSNFGNNNLQTNGIGNCNSGNTVIIPNGNCLANAEVLVPSSVFASGIITEVVPNLQFGDVTLNGDLPVGGTIKVCGCFPVYGSVNVEGSVPSSGSAVVDTKGLGCACKN